MENEHVIGGLIRKRAELAGILGDTRARVQVMEADLDCLDRTIRLFQPGYQAGDVRPKPLRHRHKAPHGDTVRRIMDTLRQAGRMMSKAEIVAVVMDARGLNREDAELRKLTSDRIGASLLKLKRRGAVVSGDGAPGMALGWGLAG